jgi:hypothetical protein
MHYIGYLLYVLEFLQFLQKREDYIGFQEKRHFQPKIAMSLQWS